MVLPFFSDIGAVASTLVAITGAITGLAAAYGILRGSRRKDRARRLRIGWQANPETASTGAFVLNESKGVFEDVVVTVTCGLNGRDARQDIGVLPAGREHYWDSGSVHDTIRSRHSTSTVTEEARSHDTKPHGVEVTFRNGKGFWLRDHKQVERVRSLVIWAEQTRAVTLTRYFGQRSPFRRRYPVSVKVQSFERTEALEAAFTSLTATGRAPDGKETPDIIVGPHDWIGTVAHEESVIEPPISPQWLRQISPRALEALSHQHRLYAIPYVLDTVALIRNNALTEPEPMPESFIEIVAAGARGIAKNGVTDGTAVALQVGAPDARGNAGDPYHLWPVFTSLGGSFFGRREADDDHRFDSEATWRIAFVEAFVRLAELGRQGTLRPTMSRSQALQMFLDGRAPFLIGSSRCLAAIRSARLDVTVAAVPPAGQHPATPMVSAYGLYVYRGAPNLAAARDLVTSYVFQSRAGLDLNRIQPLVPVQVEAMSAVAERDSALRPYVELCRRGQLMPSWPQMRAAWQLFGNTEYEVLANPDAAHSLAEAAASEGERIVEQLRGGASSSG